MTRRRLPGILELFVKSRPCPGAVPPSLAAWCPPLGQGDSPARGGSRDVAEDAPLCPMGSGGHSEGSGGCINSPIRWQVSIKVPPITAASSLPLTRGWPSRQLRVTRAPMGDLSTEVATAPGVLVARGGDLCLSIIRGHSATLPSPSHAGKFPSCSWMMGRDRSMRCPRLRDVVVLRGSAPLGDPSAPPLPTAHLTPASRAN